MEKDVFIVLGNGFSIDLINHLKMTEKVNLKNLFANGDRIPLPADNEPGFLSCRRCPELWKLGARPNLDNSHSAKIIEDIITCANVYTYSPKSTTIDEKNVYIRAYRELVAYLKYLFIYYNQIIDDTILNKESINGWGWYKLFSNLNNNSKITKVNIITYNYDIFLERILKIMNIEFSMAGFDDDNKKFRIIKPHGSISFRSSKKYDKASFDIKYNRDGLGGTLNDLVIEENPDFDVISNINTMIPPAGESGRYKLVWSKTLIGETLSLAKELKEDDEVIFGGLSYCSVDRQEIDNILIELNSDVKVKIVNPDTQNTFGAVLSSVFNEYIMYTNSNILEGLYND